MMFKLMNLRSQLVNNVAGLAEFFDKAVAIQIKLSDIGIKVVKLVMKPFIVGTFFDDFGDRIFDAAPPEG